MIVKVVVFFIDSSAVSERSFDGIHSANLVLCFFLIHHEGKSVQTLRQLKTVLKAFCKMN